MATLVLDADDAVAEVLAGTLVDLSPAERRDVVEQLIETLRERPHLLRRLELPRIDLKAETDISKRSIMVTAQWSRDPTEALKSALDNLRSALILGKQ